MDQLKESCKDLIQRIKYLKRIRYLISKTIFQQVYQKASKEEKARVVNFISLGEIVLIKEWFKKNNKNLVLEAMTVRELRELASSLGIKSYTQYTKSSLIFLIGERQNEQN